MTQSVSGGWQMRPSTWHVWWPPFVVSGDEKSPLVMTARTNMSRIDASSLEGAILPKPYLKFVADTTFSFWIFLPHPTFLPFKFTDFTLSLQRNSYLTTLEITRRNVQHAELFWPQVWLAIQQEGRPSPSVFLDTPPFSSTVRFDDPSERPAAAVVAAGQRRSVHRMFTGNPSLLLFSTNPWIFMTWRGERGRGSRYTAGCISPEFRQHIVRRGCLQEEVAGWFHSLRSLTGRRSKFKKVIKKKTF